ncbi:MAG: hypothetical protein U0869_21225 [Chloroflexota bacterium]
MTAVTLPEIDLARLRAAVERLDLPTVDLPWLDLERIDLEGARRDLRPVIARLRSALEDEVGQLDLSKLDRARLDLSKVDLARIDLPAFDLPAFDLPDVSLPSIDALLGRRRRPEPWITPGSVSVALLAMLGGLAAGAVVAFYLNPAKGAQRRRALRRRLGRAKRRLLG